MRSLSLVWRRYATNGVAPRRWFTSRRLPSHDQPSSASENRRITSDSVRPPGALGSSTFEMPSWIENTPPPKNSSSATMNE